MVARTKKKYSPTAAQMAQYMPQPVINALILFILIFD